MVGIQNVGNYMLKSVYDSHGVGIIELLKTQAGVYLKLWDVSTAVYSALVSVAAIDTSPRGMFFKPDGTRMYMVGHQNGNVNEYTLSTPWDVSTAVYSTLISVAAKDTSPRGMFFKPDGTRMYMVGHQNGNVNEYTLSTPWDVSTAVYSTLISVAAKDTSPRGMFFKPDGTRMYMVGHQNGNVNEYTLSTPWDVSTAVYSTLISVAAKDTSPRGMFFKPDGTRMYMVGHQNGNVNEYTLSTPWDVSTAVYSTLISVAAKDTSPRGMFFKPDGTRMYMVGHQNGNVNEYTLGAYGIGDMRRSIYDSDINSAIDLGALPAITQAEHNAHNSSVTMAIIGTWYDSASVSITTLAVDVLIMASIQHSNAAADKWNNFRINIDGASYSQEYTCECPLGGAAFVANIVHKATLSAGAHTIKIQGQTEQGNGYIARSDIIVLELKK